VKMIEKSFLLNSETLSSPRAPLRTCIDEWCQLVDDFLENDIIGGLKKDGESAKNLLCEKSSEFLKLEVPTIVRQSESLIEGILRHIEILRKNDTMIFLRHSILLKDYAMALMPIVTQLQHSVPIGEFQILCVKQSELIKVIDDLSASTEESLMDIKGEARVVAIRTKLLYLLGNFTVTLEKNLGTPFNNHLQEFMLKNSSRSTGTINPTSSPRAQSPVPVNPLSTGTSDSSSPNSVGLTLPTAKILESTGAQLEPPTQTPELQSKH